MVIFGELQQIVYSQTVIAARIKRSMRRNFHAEITDALISFMIDRGIEGKLIDFIACDIDATLSNDTESSKVVQVVRWNDKKGTFQELRSEPIASARPFAGAPDASLCAL